MNDIPETEPKQLVTVKVSRLAITAISLALSGLIFTIMVAISALHPVFFRFAKILYFSSCILLISSIILGIISFIHIERSGGRKTGDTFASGAIFIPLITFLISGIFLPALANVVQVEYRLSCGTNLSNIGKAMLIYANDYDEKLPRAGGSKTVWGTSVNWYAENVKDAFGLDSNDTGGAATISSSLYLLVKYAEVPPEKFICAEDRKMSKFDPAKNNKRGKDITQFWDFGPQPWKHNSYAYHMPYSSYFLTTENNPGMVVAADRNPWMPSPGWKVKDFAAFNPDGDRKAILTGNAFSHRNEGQNVLYLDSHVSFDDRSFYGVNQDNIYTSWNGSDIRKGTPPKVGSQPVGNTDSLLVNDPPVQKR